MAKSPSIRDVAQLAKVSIGTASRALNNKSNVLPETRAQVLKAATELGYKLQFRVPTSVSSKLNTIGVVMKSDPGRHSRVDPFHYVILTGVEAECQKLGISLMFSRIEVDEYSHAISTPPILGDDSVDGLIIVGTVLSDPAIAASIPSDIPVALVDSYNPHREMDSVHIDNLGGAYKALNYILSHGHRRIGLIASNGSVNEHPGVRVRREVYLQVLRENGITDTYIQDSYLSPDSGYEATMELMSKWPEVTAIFACNDLAASGAISALNEMGLRVPEDVSIVGFDDTDHASQTTPKLTTIFVDKFLMGTLGVRHLFDRAIDLERVPIETQIHTRLIERESIISLVDRPTRVNTLRAPDT